MQEEKLLLTRQDRDRLKVLHQVWKGHLRQREAAEQLKVTERWIRKLVGRVKEKGDKAVIHGLRGQPSKRRIAEKLDKRAVEIMGWQYEDLGRRWRASIWRGITTSRQAGETVRQWMMRAGLWKRRRQRLQEVHLWRRRRSCFGELVQWDTSERDWLEGRGEKIYLIAMVADTFDGVRRFLEKVYNRKRLRSALGYLPPAEFERKLRAPRFARDPIGDSV